MYKDCITNIKAPVLYILMNSKREFIYNLVFESVLSIITQYNKYKLSIHTIVTDSEIAFINVTNKFFPKSRRISCYIHYNQDLLRNILSYGLYRNEDKPISNIILKKLSLIPVYYKSNMEYVKEKIILKENIQNIKIILIIIILKIKYLIDKSLDYC